MLAERARRIKPSPTLSMDAKAKAMKAQGVDVVNFGVGEPDFDTPDHVKDAAIRAIREGFTKYTPVGGIDDLKKAIVETFGRDDNLEYTPEEIIVSCGAKHSLYNIAQALYGPGDEVIIPSPYWVSYPDQVLLNDATPVFVETSEQGGFLMRPEAFEAAITGKTRALIVNSPSNPTGMTYDRKTLEKIAEAAVRHNIFVISDEIYSKLVYDGASHVSIASLGREIKDRTIVVNGLSKSFAMTGWRIGYAAGPKEVIKAMTSIQSQSTSNPTSIAQKAAVAALNGPQDFVLEMRAEFDRRRRFLVDSLNGISGVNCPTPTGAFYVFPNVSKCYGRGSGKFRINSSFDLASYLLEQARVALVHGEAFGNDACIRLSYATSLETIEKGVNRIAEALAPLS
ncbi:MAG TPA: pyridoxal phosphate-dependent aminotransferase [Dissulfurispiraceae bacterium]|nr:pyridoxal phosphate-dependent aminotransferase [Dissulfurispiraceae bacterium]